jgi:uncharacterized protein (DUF58 family)
MKIKHAIYFVCALAGAAFLFLSNTFRIKELGLALGFSLLMLGLYDLSKRNLPAGRETTKTEGDETL